MCWTRDAAHWEIECSYMVLDAGFKKYFHSMRALHPEQIDMRAVDHGDDISVLGKNASMDWLRGVIEQSMEVKYKAKLERGPPGVEGARAGSYELVVGSRGFLWISVTG